MAGEVNLSGLKPDQVAFFWGCDKTTDTKDTRKKLESEQKGVILNMGHDKKNNPRFKIVMGEIKHYPDRESVIRDAGVAGFDIDKGKNKGVITWDGNSLESVDHADCIIITALPNNKVELELYRRPAGGRNPSSYPGEKSIKKVIYEPKITQTIKNMGFDLTDNTDNLGKILSPALSQYLYDFALGQGDFAPKEASKTNPKK